jgi:hypothetical protein
MALLRLKQRVWGGGVTAFSLLLLNLLAGCGAESGTRTDAAGEVGYISFSIVWEDDSIYDPGPSPSRFTCGAGTEAVAVVTAQIANASHTITPPGDHWNCSDGQGAIPDVPVGDDYTLTVVGYNTDGQTTFSAEESGITIVAGDNPVGPLVAERFETISYGPYLRTDRVAFSWDETTGATEYRLRISESPDLSDPIIDELISGVEHDLSFSDEGLQPYSQYWWCVVPVAFGDRDGYLSDDMIRDFISSDDNYGDISTLEMAFDISANQNADLSSLDGPGVVTSDNPIDIYKIDLPEGVGTLSIECSHSYAEGDIDIELLDGEGGHLYYAESATDDESLYVDLSDNGGGTYYIKVFLFEGEGSDESIINSYDLWWDSTLDPTALLLGSWYFEFSIGTTSFSYTYCLDEISDILNDQGEPIVNGTDAYDNPVLATYWPEDEYWELFDGSGSILHMQFIFKTDGKDIIEADSCYYQLDPDTDERISDCFQLGGYKESDTCS